MVDSRLPWWLILLLGVWVISLTLWSWPRAQREIRWGAGLLSLAYLLLIFLALGGDPRTAAIASEEVVGSAAKSWPVLMANAVGLVAGFLLLGRPQSRGQLTWYTLLTLANATSCLASGAIGVGWSLLLMASAVSGVLILELSRGDGASLPEWFPLSKPDLTTVEQTVESVSVIAVTGLLLAMVFVGTIAYVMRVEVSRTNASQHFSAIPSADQIQKKLPASRDAESFSTLGVLILGRRADIVVLLSALAFLALAMHNSTSVVGVTCTHRSGLSDSDTRDDISDTTPASVRPHSAGS